jgi:hypothetical protein
VLKFLPYYTHRRCENKRTTIYLERRLLDRLPAIQSKSLRIMNKLVQTGTIAGLNNNQLNVRNMLEIGSQEQ